MQDSPHSSKLDINEANPDPEEIALRKLTVSSVDPVELGSKLSI